MHYFFIKRKEIKKHPLKTIFAPQFLSMLVLSMPLFFALWPYLWYDTVDRFVWYANFHIKHYGILMYYLGNIYSDPRPPWHAPMVMALVTTPLITTFFSLISPFVYKWKNEKNRYAPLLLVSLSAAVSISALMFLPAPFYSGVKLFQPLFPFVAILAGVGLYYMLNQITFIPHKYKYAPSVLFFIPVILSMVSLKHDHLSFYSSAIGGLKGAVKFGFERHYYDLYYIELADFFNKECKEKRCRVKFEPNGHEYKHTSRLLKNSKLLTNNFEYVSSGEDYFVLTHEYRWKNYPSLLKKYKNKKLVYILKREGIPLLNVYKIK